MKILPPSLRLQEGQRWTTLKPPAAGLSRRRRGRLSHRRSQVALAVLKAADLRDEILVVSRPGWHRLDGCDHPVFVTPASRAIGDAPASTLELVANARYDTVRGSLDGWKAAAAAAASVKGCPHFLTGVLAGFCGVVQSLAGLDSCGINLSGLSSSGKTTAQRLAVSAWTSTAVGAGLLQSMRSTENAIEVFAEAASGTVLALDELAHADGRAISKLIYAIVGGQAQGDRRRRQPLRPCRPGLRRTAGLGQAAPCARRAARPHSR